MSNPSLNDMDWSDVVFAHGHLFAPAARLGGTEVPLRSAKVKGDALAQMMLAADFIQLEQAGAISLGLDSSQLLFIKTETVRVTKLKDAAAGAVTRAILDQITGDAKKDNVKGIVYRMIGQDVADPVGVVANWAKKALLASGYYHSEGRGKIAQMLAGNKLVPNSEQLAPLAPLAETIQSALRDAEIRNAAIYKRLLQDCLDALRSRVKEESKDD